ncbi:MAG: hypothetical protein FJ217_13800 [Ignavibacteria bacterium]|nr:hypothetical protein [Ignavibacteria bacterium]
MKRISTIILLLCIFLMAHFSLLAQNQAVKLGEPVLLTSCGQSPGPLKVKVFFSKMKIDHVYNPQARVGELTAKQKEGKPYKSVIIVTGASLKGMGAAQVSIDDEIKRVKEIIAEAKKQGIKVVGAHVEGMERRAQGAAPGDNSDELSIDAVCPVSDLLIVRSDGDEDKRFTAISTGKKIPMVTFEKNMELSDVLKNLYQK